MAKALANAFITGLLEKKFKVVEEFKGKKIVGIEYEPLYDIKSLQNKNSHKIVAGDFWFSYILHDNFVLTVTIPCS